MGNDQYNFQWAMINWVASRTSRTLTNLTNPRTHEPVNVVDDTFNTTPLFWALYSWFEEPVASAEAGIRTALTGLALLSIGDGSAAAQFQRALDQNAPIAPTQFLLGAARAMQSRDPDAIAA